MIVAFKISEKADDYGFTWWWALLIFFALLSLFLAGQGIGFLGRFDDVRESKAAYTNANGDASGILGPDFASLRSALLPRKDRWSIILLYYGQRSFFCVLESSSE